MSLTGEQFAALVKRILAANPDASDIVMTPGKATQVEVHGELTDAGGGQDKPLTPATVRAMAATLLEGSKVHQRQLAARGSCDLSYSLPGTGRFRVNIYRQRGNLALVLRRLPVRVPTREELGLPEVFADVAAERYGLVLVTGGTGTGKSNSLAALVDEINATRSVHIVTLEDPVEFTHSHKKGVVSQRELHADFDAFPSGLRAALRQAPKVIMVGEIRDRESMAIALQAAGTGHLVLATIHASDAGSTVSRVLGLFEPGEERVVRMQLAESLRFVISQRLVAREGGGRVAAFEVLRNTLRSRELMLGGETADKSFYRVMEQGQAKSMQTFDQSLFALYEAGEISEDTAVMAASDRARLRLMLDRLKASRGESSGELKLGGLEEF